MNDRERAGRDTGPRASRPHLPGYGIPKAKKGLLSWSHVTERVASAHHYWVCSSKKKMEGSAINDDEPGRRRTSQPSPGRDEEEPAER